MTVSHDKQQDESDVLNGDDNMDNESKDGLDLRGDPSLTLVPAMDQYISAYT